MNIFFLSSLGEYIYICVHIKSSKKKPSRSKVCVSMAVCVYIEQIKGATDFAHLLLPPPSSRISHTQKASLLPKYYSSRLPCIYKYIMSCIFIEEEVRRRRRRRRKKKEEEERYGSRGEGENERTVMVQNESRGRNGQPFQMRETPTPPGGMVPCEGYLLALLA
jgi:hypothetical protein